MQRISPKILKQIKESLKRTTGTVLFTFTTENNLFNPDEQGGIIFEIVSGVQYFRIERTDKAEINFYHSLPGTGTRVASVSLTTLKPSSKIRIGFTWHPLRISLFVSSFAEPKKIISADGIDSEITFKVDKLGKVIQIGDVGVQIMNLRVSENGQETVSPTAIEIWRQTKTSIELHLTGKSDQGYLYEVIQANFALVMLVTGFETYCKARFAEVELEGFILNTEKLLKRKLSKEELVKPHTNYFQSFERSKEIYKLSMGIQFSDLVSSSTISMMIKVFAFRHKVIHRDPQVTTLEPLENGNPEFSTKIVSKAVKEFDSFIEKLHEETLNLTN